VNITDKCEGELHEALNVAIPSLIQLLAQRDINARSAAVSVIGNLANHGKLQGNIMWTRTSLMLMIDKFHKTLEVAISSLVDLFKNLDAKARSAAVSVIGNLANHGKLQGNITWTRTSLMLMIRQVS